MPDSKDDLPALPPDASVRRDAEPEPQPAGPGPGPGPGPAPGQGGPPFYNLAWPGYHRSHDYEITQDPPPVAAEDDAAIAGVALRYHSLSPEEFAASWREVATDPYYSFQKEGVVPVNDGLIQAWLRGPELAGFQERFPLASPRRVQLHGLQILYVGNSRAVVTYRLEEEGRDGQVLAGNGSLIVVKVEGKGWRVVALVKEERSARAAAQP